MRKQRPKFLALNEIRLPLPGIVSILHRVSGVGLFLMLPFLLYLLDRSLGSPESFAAYKSVVGNPLVKLLLDSGVDVKAKDQYGLTALVYALKNKRPEIVKLIKDAGGSY